MSDVQADDRVAPDECEPVRARISSIGLVSYCAIPPHYCFVRIPNERGRWILAHRCVVEIMCGYCKAVAGEPCFNPSRASMPRRYGVGTHSDRRHQYNLAWRNNRADHAPHKPVIPLQDIRDAGAVYG